MATAATLGACNGSSAGEANGPRSGGPALVATLGDSITAGAPGYDPSARVRRLLGLGHNPRSQYEYWAHRVDPRLRFRNCGVYGETTSQIAARLRGCARGADELIVQGGINDIAHALASPAPLRRLAVNEAGTNLAQMVQRGKGLGLRVAIADVLPWNRGYPEAAPLIDRLNHLIHVTGKLERVPVLPFNGVLASARNPDLMKPSLTADGAHPSISGYRRLGRLVASRLG